MCFCLRLSFNNNCTAQTCDILELSIASVYILFKCTPIFIHHLFIHLIRKLMFHVFMHVAIPYTCRSNLFKL